MSIPQERLAPEHSTLIWGTLVVQLALVSVSFPVTELLTAAPLFYIDSPFHWYEIETAKSFAAAWRLVGYDPYFAAGYIGGIGFNASVKFPAVLSVISSPWLSTIVTYKLYVFGAAVLGPACVPLAAHWLRLSGRVSVAATVLALLLWWLSGLRWFHTAGMVSFVFAAYLALPYAALAVRYLTEVVAWPAFVALAGVGAVGMLFHPLFPLLVAPLIVSFTFAYWQDITVRRLFLIYAVLPVFCLLPNLLWILPTLKYPSFASGDLSPYQKTVDLSIVWNEALGRITFDARGSRVNIVIWFAVLWALTTKLERRAKRTIVAVTLTSMILIFIAALGSALPVVGTLQPNRFSSAAYLYLCIPAAFGAVVIAESLFSHGIRRVAAVGSAGLLVAALGFFGRELARELSYADISHHGEQPPEVRGIGPDSAWILEWLKKNTSTDARVLFETSKARIHDQAHMVGYYALASNREFIGGPYPYMHFAGFWDGFLFGNPIKSFSQQQFADDLRLYNVGWIIVFSEASKQFLNRMPDVVPLDQFGQIQTYAVREPHSFFAKGAGTIVARSFNRIELSQLSGPSVVLKYHYVLGLESIPPARLEPVQLPGDPEPFVGIIEPPSRLILQMR